MHNAALGTDLTQTGSQSCISRVALATRLNNHPKDIAFTTHQVETLWKRCHMMFQWKQAHFALHKLISAN